MLPYLQLRHAWLINGRYWVERYPAIHATNRGYVTESVAVPIPVIMRALAGAMTLNWDASQRPRLELTVVANSRAEEIDVSKC